MTAIVLKDRVKETTSTTGTSDFVLGGASSGYQAFSVIGPNNFTYYCCFDNATGDWEVGYGQYTTTAGGTLVRNTVLSNSAATTSKIAFAAGPKDVFITYPAEKAIYEEDTGNVLIDGGPITVVGNGVTGYTTFSAALGEMYADVDSFAQLYAQNLNDGSEASADLVVYNDLGDGTYNFADMGINSSNYTSATYPIFTPGSAYFFNDGGELFLGSATDDVVLFAGGTDVADEAVRIDKTTKLVTTAAGMTLGGALTGVGGSFTSPVTSTSSMATPGSTEFVTRAYVDDATSNGFHVHTPVLVATTGNLTATYNNGTSGVGATLTNSGAQAALSVDGVSLSVNDRVLVWQQTTGTQNGIYVVTTVGSGATNWVLTRSSDADTSSEGDPNSLGGGDYFFVQSGTTLGYHSFICNNTSAIVFGTTAITFAEFSSVPTYTGGTNISVSGSVISLTGTVAATNGGTGTATVTTGDLLYGSGTNTWGKLAAGAAYRSLVMNAGGTSVEWNAVALNQSGAVSGALPATNGGTGQSAYALGDILYSDATNSVARLAGNTTTTKKFLGQTGTGTGSAAPVWEQPAASDITGLAASATTDTTNASNISSGTLGTGRLSGSYTGITGVGTLTAGTWNGSTVAAGYGGTGFASYAVGDLLYADTSTSLAKLADVAVGNALISGGVGSAPSWGKIGLATHVDGTLPIANGGTGNTTGQAASVANAVTFDTSGGAAAGTTYDGSTTRTIDYSTVGAQATLVSGTNIKTINSTSLLGSGDITIAASPAGSAGQIQYNDGFGNFAATSIVASYYGSGSALTVNYFDPYSYGFVNIGTNLSGVNAALYLFSGWPSANANDGVTTDYALGNTGGVVSGRIGVFNTNATFDDSYMSFSTMSGGSLSEVARFNNVGNLTMGFGSGTQTLPTTAGTGTKNVIIKGANSSNGGNIQLANATPSSGLPYIGALEWHIMDNSGNLSGTRAAMIRAQVSGVTATKYGADLMFYTKADNVSGTGTLRMIIDNAGNVLVGTTSNPNGSKILATGSTTASSVTSAAEFRIGGSGENGGQILLQNTYSGATNINKWLRVSNAGNFQIVNSAYNALPLELTDGGNLVCSGNITAYSDETLKTNWRELPNDFVELLATTKSGIYDRTDINETQVGVSAQSLRSFMPQAVGDISGKLSVAYGNAAMVSAVQLAKRVVEQDERIARLEALVAKLTQQGT